MLGILIAVISGALMSIQGVFNTNVTKQTSIWLSSSFVQLTAFITCAAALIITTAVTGNGVNVTQLFKIDNKYMLLGGVIGAFITFTVIQSMNMLGPAKSVIIIVVAQLLIAYIIELTGLFGVEKVTFQIKNLIGMLLAISGIIIFKW